MLKNKLVLWLLWYLSVVHIGVLRILSLRIGFRKAVFYRVELRIFQ